MLCRSNNISLGCKRGRKSVTTKALFNWGKKDEEAEAYKEEEYRVQQELLAKRRTGELIKTANERRNKVVQTSREKREARQAERDSLAEGVIPESLKSWKNYKNKKDEGTLFDAGIVVPLLPFGIKEYDDGERFDLRSPYADDGWVDPEEAEDPWIGVKKLFGFKKDEPAKPKDKRVIWASQYEKYKAEQAAAKQAAQQAKTTKGKGKK